MNITFKTVLKKFFFCVAVLGTVLAMAANKGNIPAGKTQSFDGEGWFAYSGGTGSAQEHSTANYSYVSDEEPGTSGCAGSTKLCMVKLSYTVSGSQKTPVIPTGDIRDNASDYYEKD